MEGKLIPIIADCDGINIIIYKLQNIKIDPRNIPIKRKNMLI
jgi:hypothetical protein